MTAPRTLVIGCGNVLRGDDAAGPVLVRRLWERGLPEGVRCADGGTGGMDVAFQMRGVPEVILVDACRSGSEPGSLFEVPGDEVENLPPLSGINLHAFRWDHAIAFARWLLKDEYPGKVTAYLVEGERFAVGEGLSPAVDRAVDQLAELLLERLSPSSPEARDRRASAASPALLAALASSDPQQQGVARAVEPASLASGGGEAESEPARSERKAGCLERASGDTARATPAHPNACESALLASGGREAESEPAIVTVPRPQPVGIFPFPASHLLLPPGDEPAAEPARAALLRGDLAAEVPDAWRFFTAAARGDVAAATRLVADDSPLAAYNRFVLAPTPAGLTAIEREGNPTLRSLARSAAYAHGLVDDVADDDSLDGELRAVVLITVAAARLESGLLPEACAALEVAAAAAEGPTPLLAAIALGQLADVIAGLAEPGDPVPPLERAVGLAAGTALPGFAAELSMKLGLALQQGANGDRPRLIEAIKCYQQAIAAGLSAEAAPAAYVQLQNNLGLAYLSTPTREASDQLRTGIAVQSFREALRVCDRERDPDTWASVQMNLASALQYIPSSHPAENLAQAVEAYEEVLQVRTEARDPVAHGRVLLNQANALAHLGIFKPAIEKLATAMKLLSWYGHDDEAAAARELLAGIQERLDDARAAAAAEQRTTP